MVYGYYVMGEIAMSRTISQPLRTELNSQVSSDPFLLLVTIEHENFSTVRFVNNTENITSQGNEYFAFPIKIVLPNDDGESTPSITMELDNVSLEIIDELRIATTPPLVSVEAVLASDPDYVEINYDQLNLSSIQYNESSIKAQLTFDDILNSTVPSEKYEPDNFPGIF